MVMGNPFAVTSYQKVLDYLAGHPGKEVLASEVQRATRISKAGAHLALCEMSKHGYVIRERKGNVFLYSIDYKNPIVKQLKVLKTVFILEPVLKKLRKSVQKVVLFGSSARGENTIDSDIDLLVVTVLSREHIQSLISGPVKKNKIQLIIYNPNEFDEIKHGSPVFFQEVDRGICLWSS
jgi:DNA-binding transcriptional ArsR family regulator